MSESIVLNVLIKLSKPNQFNETEFNLIMNLPETNKLLKGIIIFFKVKENNKRILANTDFDTKILERTTERFLRSQNSEIKIKFLEIFNNSAIHDYYLNTSNINDYNIFNLLLKHKNVLLKNMNTKILYLNVIRIIIKNHNFVEKYPQEIEDILSSLFNAVKNSIPEPKIEYKYLDIIQVIIKNSNFTKQYPQLLKDILFLSFKSINNKKINKDIKIKYSDIIKTIVTNDNFTKQYLQLIKDILVQLFESIDNKTINQNTRNKYLDIIQTIATNNNFIEQHSQEVKYILVQSFEFIKNLEADNDIANECFNIIKKVLENSSFINQNPEAIKDILDRSFKTFNSLNIKENIKEYCLCIIQEIVKNRNFTVYYPQAVKDLLDWSFRSINDQKINQYDKNKYLQIIQTIVENNNFTEQHQQLIRNILISSFESAINPGINQYNKYKYLDIVNIIVKNNNFTEQYQGTVVDILIQLFESIKNETIDQEIKIKYLDIINIIIKHKKYSSVIDNLKEKINSDVIRQQTMNVVFDVENLLNDIKQKVQEKISNGNTGNIIETIKDSIKESLNPIQLIEKIEKKIPNIKGENANIIKLFLSGIIDEIQKNKYLANYVNGSRIQANILDTQTLKNYIDNGYIYFIDKVIKNTFEYGIGQLNIKNPENNIYNTIITIFNFITESEGFKTYIKEITPFFINEEIFMNAIETKISDIIIPYGIDSLNYPLLINIDIEDRDVVRSTSYILRNIAMRKKNKYIEEDIDNLIKTQMLELIVQTDDIKVIENYRDILKFYQNYNIKVATTVEEMQTLMEAIKRSPENNNKLAREIRLIYDIINKRKESPRFYSKKDINDILDSLQDVSNNMDKGGNLDSYMDNLNHIVELNYFPNDLNVLNKLKELSLKIIGQTEDIKVIENYDKMLYTLKRKNCICSTINGKDLYMIMNKIEKIFIKFYINNDDFIKRANELAKNIQSNYDNINNIRFLAANLIADKSLTFEGKKAQDMF